MSSKEMNAKNKVIAIYALEITVVTPSFYIKPEVSRNKEKRYGYES